MLRRTAFKPKLLPPARAAKQWTGDVLPGPRTPALRIADGNARAIVSIPKAEPLRSELYRRWVATLPCMACGILGYSQAAHPNQGRGLGQKASDALVFPLCCVRPGHMGCHQMHDLLLDMTLEQRRAAELLYIERTQAMARAAGRKEIA
jgi:hypothetical protein